MCRASGVSLQDVRHFLLQSSTHSEKTTDIDTQSCKCMASEFEVLLVHLPGTTGFATGQVKWLLVVVPGTI